jgi:AraC family transcriptional regulator
MKETTLRFYKERLLRVLVHIQQHLDERLGLEELAGLACLAPHHFHHVFTGMLGESVGGYVRRLRLERAALRLKLGRMAVTQIALEAGYATPESFSRVFRGSFDASPTQFWHRHDGASQVRVPSGVHYRADGKFGNFRTTKAGATAMNVTIKQIQPRRVAFMRHVGPYNKVGSVWEEFTMFLGREGLLCGDVQFIGISHDDPAVTLPEKVRYDACVTVDESFQPVGEIGVQIISGGEYAVLTHFGSYEKLGASYSKLLGQWLPRSGRNLRSTPCFEVYFNTPENTDPEDLVTDIHAPLEPA